MEQNNTFWKIVSNNEIIIPTIQRDYAYGRTEAKAIRSNLLSGIKSTLDNETDSALHLAFVYGKLEGKENDEALARNVENIRALLNSVQEYANDLDIAVNFDTQKNVVKLSNNVKFIPIDGQQRLTTLYLLHWYLAIQLRNADGLNVLQKFSYATRISSKEFCSFLCALNIEPVIAELDADLIRNQEGFFKQWEKDPTVKNMLIVLDNINQEFGKSKERFEYYWRILTESERVCFDFFDLDNFQLTDELYVKMNSRGKKLTQFENFKAWLYHHVSIDHETKKKIDIDWHDLFWKAQVNDEKDVDAAYLQWFKNLLLADFLKETENKKNNNDLRDVVELQSITNQRFLGQESAKSIIAVLRSPDSRFFDLLVQGSEIEKLLRNNSQRYLNMLSNVATEYDGNLKLNVNPLYIGATIEELLFTEIENLNWWQLTLQYAVVVYCGSAPYNEQNFIDYLRVISNLIFNTAIDSPNDYLQAIKSIDAIVKSSEGKILEYLAKENTGNILFFSIDQKTEEIRKAAKCLEPQIGNDWRNAFIKFEEHAYFYGQIGFIFEILEGDWVLEKFVDKGEKISALFSEQVLDRTDYLLLRSFLSSGDCLFRNSDNINFYINIRNTLRNRAENWRRFLGHYVEFVNMIIGHAFFDKNNVIASLQNIISNDKILVEGRYISAFIDHPFLFDYAKRNCIRNYKENYYLLNSTLMRGKYVELYTYLWYHTKREEVEANLPFDKIEYIEARGFDDEPGLKIVYEGMEKKLERNSDTGKFKIGKSDDEYETIEETLSTLITQ